MHIDEERAARVRELEELWQNIKMPTLTVNTTDFLPAPVKSTPGKVLKVAPAGKKSVKRGLPDEKRNEILNLNRAGKTDAEIIEEAEVSKSTIYRVLQEAGLKSNPGLRKARRSREELEDEPAATRRTAMNLNKFQQVKIALSHQIPAETIAKELNLTKDEVHKAELAKTYDAYAAA